MFLLVEDSGLALFSGRLFLRKKPFCLLNPWRFSWALRLEISLCLGDTFHPALCQSTETKAALASCLVEGGRKRPTQETRANFQFLR
jgi:hypothetical protein